MMELAKIAKPFSNNDILRKAKEVALQLPQLWAKGGAKVKEALQKLVFPFFNF